MAPSTSNRPSWKGQLRISLVTAPVRAFNVEAPGEGKIHFRQIHDKCQTPIKYQKVCPIHGEIPKEEIVLGYEFEPHRYALVNPDELDGGRKRDRILDLDAFIPIASVDPLHLEGGMHYLLPDGAAAGKPYAVLQKALAAREACGIGEMAAGDRDQLVMIRPYGDLLLAVTLRFNSQINAADKFEGELESVKVSREELKMAETLIDLSTSDAFQPEKYADDYTARLEKLIQDKIAGKEIAEPEADEEPAPVISLMSALKKSVAARQAGGDSRPRLHQPREAKSKTKLHKPSARKAAKATPAKTPAQRGVAHKTSNLPHKSKKRA